MPTGTAPKIDQRHSRNEDVVQEVNLRLQELADFRRLSGGIQRPIQQASRVDFIVRHRPSNERWAAVSTPALRQRSECKSALSGARAVGGPACHELTG